MDRQQTVRRTSLQPAWEVFLGKPNNFQLPALVS
jgi:hypothetical protein